MQCRLYLNLVNEGDNYPQYSDQMVFIYTWQLLFSILEYLGKVFLRIAFPLYSFSALSGCPMKR